ncbi:MAG TPA: hypothetical protein VNJ71_12940 [Gemmatimonadales bacterium]|nr:hypothetical protein [Gemmatimonadales bacterium]
MRAPISAAWLLKGHCDCAGQDRSNTTTVAIRAPLCEALGRPRDGLQIANYSVGPQLKHTFWWREGSTDDAETQFVATISRKHPVLSLGLSVEKGLEGKGFDPRSI